MHGDHVLLITQGFVFFLLTQDFQCDEIRKIELRYFSDVTYIIHFQSNEEEKYVTSPSSVYQITTHDLTNTLRPQFGKGKV